MMLRVAVVVLLAANVLFFAWSRGWLDDIVGVRAGGEREPERLARQVRPEAVRVMPAAAAPTMAPACVEAGPFGAAELAAAEQALGAAVPAGSWTRVAIERPGRWVVYMGRFPNRDALERRLDALRRAQIDAEELSDQPEHEPGISLGSHDSRAAAEAALERLQQRGIRTARVLTLAPPATDYVLRLDRGDAAWRTRALALQASALGAGFSPCADRR